MEASASSLEPRMSLPEAVVRICRPGLVRAITGGIAFYRRASSSPGCGSRQPSQRWGLALNVFMVSIVQSVSNAIWQPKVAPQVQGRVFSLRRLKDWERGRYAA